MSANVYSVRNLLIGKTYNSATLKGEITDAELTSAVWYADCETYLVEVAPNSGYNNFGRKTYRYVAVKVAD